MDDEAQFTPGQRIGAYEVVRLLGSGAFGAVYEALRLPLRRRAALKILHPEHLRHREVVQRFLREAEVVAQLEHPNIVSVYDVGEHEGAPFIAMEYLDGEPLSARIERLGSLPPSAAIDVLLPVMAALAAVHERGIVHRDLKPDNIFLARLPSGGVQPKLLDFGIAKVREADHALTRTNAMMGTPHYMSPEQAQESKHIDAASDQWSLGVILFECLCGQRPFRGESLLVLLSAIAGQIPPDPRTLAPAVPAELGAVVLRALAKLPADRWPSVRALGAALVPFAGDGVHAQWSGFFLGAAHALDATHADGSQRPSRTSSLPNPGTLQPTTRSLVEAGLRTSPRARRLALTGAALTLSVVAVVVVAASFAPRSAAPGVTAHVAARPSPVVVPTPIQRPSSSQPAYAHAPAAEHPHVTHAEPAVAPVPVVVVPDAPVAAGVAPVAVTVVDPPDDRRHGRRRSRRRRDDAPAARAPDARAHAAESPRPTPARTDCANGICTVD